MAYCGTSPKRVDLDVHSFSQCVSVFICPHSSYSAVTTEPVLRQVCPQRYSLARSSCLHVLTNVLFLQRRALANPALKALFMFITAGGEKEIVFASPRISQRFTAAFNNVGCVRPSACASLAKENTQKVSKYP